MILTSVVAGCAPVRDEASEIILAVGPGLADEAGRIAAAYGLGPRITVQVIDGVEADPFALVRSRKADVVLAAAAIGGKETPVPEAALPGPVVHLSSWSARRMIVGQLPLAVGVTAFGPRPRLSVADAASLLAGRLPDWEGTVRVSDLRQCPAELVPRDELIRLASSGDLGSQHAAVVRLADLGPAVAGLEVGGVRPMPETVRTGEYPLLAPVVAIWAGNDPSAAARLWAMLSASVRPAVARFVRWVQGETGRQALLGVGDLVSIAAVGDVMLDRGVARRIASSGPDYPFAEVRGILLDADLAVCNLESPPATGGAPIADKGIWFRATPQAAEAMARAGINLVSLANNHSLDYGRDAFRESLGILDGLGVAYCGGGRDLAEARAPRVVERGGLRLAFLGYSQFADLYWSGDRFTFVAGEGLPGVAPLRRPLESMDLASVRGANPHLAEDIARARALADLVVVTVHWGTEYRNEPDAFALLAAQVMVEAGADLVLGHHPHAIQGLAASGKSLAAFSLGNFVFDQDRPVTTESMILRVEVSSHGIFSWEVMPVRIAAGQPRPVDGSSDGEAIEAKILRLSGELRLQAVR